MGVVPHQWTIVSKDSVIVELALNVFIGCYFISFSNDQKRSRGDGKWLSGSYLGIQKNTE